MIILNHCTKFREYHGKWSLNKTINDGYLDQNISFTELKNAVIFTKQKTKEVDIMINPLKFLNIYLPKLNLLCSNYLTMRQS
jgi:hypothetical protein